MVLPNGLQPKRGSLPLSGVVDVVGGIRNAIANDIDVAASSDEEPPVDPPAVDGSLSRGGVAPPLLYRPWNMHRPFPPDGCFGFAGQSGLLGRCSGTSNSKTAIAVLSDVVDASACWKMGSVGVWLRRTGRLGTRSHHSFGDLDLAASFVVLVGGGEAGAEPSELGLP